IGAGAVQGRQPPGAINDTAAAGEFTGKRGAGSAHVARAHRSLAGPASCGADIVESAHLQPRGCADAGGRPWGERRHLLRHQCRTASAAAVPERRTAPCDLLTVLALVWLRLSLLRAVRT